MPSNISLGVSLLVIKMPPVLSKRMVPDQEQTTLVCHNRFKIRFDEIFTVPWKKNAVLVLAIMKMKEVLHVPESANSKPFYKYRKFTFQ